MKIKLKRKLLYVLLAALIVLVGAAALTACKIGRDEFGEYQEKYDLSGSVVYYANGGFFGGSSNLTRKELYYPKDAPMLNISESTNKLIIKRDDYTMAGWKIATGGEKDGQPVISESDPWVQFPQRIGENQHLVVYAVWTPNAKLDYYLVSKGANFTFQTEDDTSYTTGGDEPFYSSNSFLVPNSAKKLNDLFPSALKDATAVGAYSDPECTQPCMETTVQKPADGTNGKIYIRCIEGKGWSILRSTADVGSMFADIQRDGAEGKKYLLYVSMNCSGSAIGLATNTVFRGTIDGDGNTLSNLRVTRVGMKYASDYSLFGTIGSNAVIENLTIDTVELNLTLQASQSTETIAAISNGVEDGATFTDFSIKNLKMKIVAPAGSNLQNFDTVDGKLQDRGEWIFGGRNGTDEEIKTKFPIAIEGASITLN